MTTSQRESAPDSGRIFLLDSTDRNLELLLLSSGEIALHCPALVSRRDAEQIALAIHALLSGGFDRAVSESTLMFDLARRTSRPHSGSVSIPATEPNLEQL